MNYQNIGKAEKKKCVSCNLTYPNFYTRPFNFLFHIWIWKCTSLRMHIFHAVFIKMHTCIIECVCSCTLKSSHLFCCMFLFICVCILTKDNVFKINSKNKKSSCLTTYSKCFCHVTSNATIFFIWPMLNFRSFLKPYLKFSLTFYLYRIY